jgi:cell division protein FtsB
MVMKDFQGRQKYNPWFYRILVVALFAILLLGLKGLWGAWSKSQLAQKNVVEAQARLADLYKEKESLKTTVDSLSTDRGVEAEIRKNFSVVKPGEKVITIVETAGGSQVPIDPTSEKSWWQFWE